nr:MAG TPA: hypothetical protein [Caudoviricetes sp.]DAX97281.1 MAG TPA: hypothetical protein [Caudoviricetes sp.]
MWSFRVGSIPAIATKRRKMIHRLIIIYGLN